MSTMKKVLLFVAMGLLSTGAFAQDEGFAAGLKYGFDFDLDGTGDGDGYGVNLGYGFGNGFGVEFELLTGDVDAGGLVGDVDIDTMAIYGTYRSNGPGYFLGKLGYADGEADAGPFGSDDDTGLSYGIGGGYRFNESFALEGEYTIMDFDNEFTVIAVTARFPF